MFGGAPAPASGGGIFHTAAAAGAAEPRPGSVTRDLEAYVQGKEQDYMATLREAMANGGSQWQEVYRSLRREHGASPSFFLYTAGLVLERFPQDTEAAVRICTNCLELRLQDVQMMRSVGYFLVKAGHVELALAVLDRVRALAPVEPQSFLDGALARFLGLRREFREEQLLEAVRLCAVAVTHKWADRFQEVEWPALVLLHLLVELGEQHGLTDAWPVEATLRVPNFSMGLVVWLGWDTDHTDIDLHVVEPSGNEVYYSNRRSSIGGHLSKDFTQGYGPEVYLLRDAPAGTYRVRAKYYASHQQSALTGATSAVLWAMHGGKGGRQILFDTVRLDRNKEMMDVMSVTVPGVTVPAPAPKASGGLEFTDTDGDLVRLVGRKGEVDLYVNNQLVTTGVQEFSIDQAARSYRDDTGTGHFRPEEDLAELARQRDLLFGSGLKTKRKTSASRYLGGLVRGW